VSVLTVQGDARRLPLPAGSVDCIVTSPPYYLARDYTDGGTSMPGQTGQEPTPEEYLGHLAVALAECRRVLRPDGTLWWNMADCYSGKANGGESVGRSGRGDHRHVIPRRVNTTRLAPYKSLLLLPERFVLAAVSAGWVLRNRVVWHKPNGMRHPVGDRLVTLHETVFLLTRGPRYRFGLDAIREPLADPEDAGGSGSWGAGETGASSRLNVYGAPKWTDSRAGRRGHGGGPPTGQRRTHPNGRNPGDVWTIPTERGDSEHYAPMPTALCRRCILAGCEPGGVVLDPFGGGGTTALVASVLGRSGISLDLSHDYGLIARQRAADPAERARAACVPRPPVQVDGQLSLDFAESVLGPARGVRGEAAEARGRRRGGGGAVPGLCTTPR